MTGYFWFCLFTVEKKKKNPFEFQWAGFCGSRRVVRRSIEAMTSHADVSATRGEPGHKLNTERVQHDSVRRSYFLLSVSLPLSRDYNHKDPLLFPLLLTSSLKLLVWDK